MSLVVALGGNALGRGTAAEQLTALRETCAAIAPLVREGEVVVTHGNGPQVGNELLRQERAADEVPPLPLFLAVAQTQAEIGAMLETELAAASGRQVVCLLTHVHVDPDDPAFASPSKPIGPFYSAEEAPELERSAAGSSSRTQVAAFGGSSRRPSRWRSSSSKRSGPCSPATQ